MKNPFRLFFSRKKLERKPPLLAKSSALWLVLKSQVKSLRATIEGLQSQGYRPPVVIIKPVGPVSLAGSKILRRAYKNHKQARGTYEQARGWYAGLSDGQPGTRWGGRKHNFYVR